MAVSAELKARHEKIVPLFLQTETKMKKTLQLTQPLILRGLLRTFSIISVEFTYPSQIANKQEITNFQQDSAWLRLSVRILICEVCNQTDFVLLLIDRRASIVQELTQP